VKGLSGVTTDGGSFSVALPDDVKIKLAGRDYLFPNARSLHEKCFLVLDRNIQNQVVVQE